MMHTSIVTAIAPCTGKNHQKWHQCFWKRKQFVTQRYYTVYLC